MFFIGLADSRVGTPAARISLWGMAVWCSSPIRSITYSITTLALAPATRRSHCHNYFHASETSLKLMS